MGMREQDKEKEQVQPSLKFSFSLIPQGKFGTKIIPQNIFSLEEMLLHFQIECQSVFAYRQPKDSRDAKT